MRHNGLISALALALVAGAIGYIIGYAESDREWVAAVTRTDVVL